MLTRPTGMRFLTAYPTLIALFVGFVVTTAAVGYEPETAVINASQEVAELPPPTGPHPVGTVLYDWTDDSREEQWSTAPEQRRELVVQMWYPARSTRGHQAEPYVPDFDRLKKSLNQD